MTQFLIMDAGTAADLRQATEGSAERLDPREIEAGPQVGTFAVPARAKDDAAFAELAAVLAALPVTDLDPAIAWPVANE